MIDGALGSMGAQGSCHGTGNPVEQPFRRRCVPEHEMGAGGGNTGGLGVARDHGTENIDRGRGEAEVEELRRDLQPVRIMLGCRREQVMMLERSLGESRACTLDLGFGEKTGGKRMCSNATVLATGCKCCEHGQTLANIAVARFGFRDKCSRPYCERASLTFERDSTKVGDPFLRYAVSGCEAGRDQSKRGIAGIMRPALDEHGKSGLGLLNPALGGSKAAGGEDERRRGRLAGTKCDLEDEAGSLVAPRLEEVGDEAWSEQIAKIRRQSGECRLELRCHVI